MILKGAIMNAIIKKTFNVLGWISFVLAILMLVVAYTEDNTLWANWVTAFGVLSIVSFMKSK